MSCWYRKSLGDAVTAAALCDDIAVKFRQRWAAAGKPAAMAVFTRTEAPGDLHCEVVTYFSPATAELARDVGAAPCNPPARDGLALLAGDEDSPTVLFE